MSGSQKFIARNRAPRVQIEYDVELYGAEKKVQLPFVMGVLADLSGKAEQPAVADRKFVEIDVDNFDARMKAMAPRAAFTVPNTITGDGNMAVDLTFESMDDFSPSAIAAKVPALAPLLEARRQLETLMAYMDGKSGAEALIESLLAEPALLKALGGGQSDATDMEAALESLRARLPEPEPEDDTTDRTLAALAARPPAERPRTPSLDEVLGGIERREAEIAGDEAADVLAGIERRPETEAHDEVSDVLAGLERHEEVVEDDSTLDVLAAIERREEASDPDRTDDVLSAIERREGPVEEDRTADVLSAIERREEAEEKERSDEVLAGIARVEDAEDTDPTADILAGIERREQAQERDATDEVFSGIERRETVPDRDTTDDVLAGLERREEADVTDEASDILAGIERREESPEADATTDVLAGIERAEDVPEVDRTNDILAGVEPREATKTRDDAEDILAGVQRPTEAEETDDLAGVLAGLDRTEDAAPEDRTDDILASLDSGDAEREDAAELDDILSGLDAGTDGNEAADESGNVPAGGSSASPTAPDAQDPTEASPSEREPSHPADDDVFDAEDPDAVGATAQPQDAASDLDDLLADLGGAVDDDIAEEPDALDDLDALLADLGGEDPPAAPDGVPVEHFIDAPDPDGLEEDLGSTDEAPPLAAEDAAAADDLDALLAELGGNGPSADADRGAPDALDDLDDLLAGLGADKPGSEATDEDAARSEAVQNDAPDIDDASGDLDDLLAELGAAEVGDDAQADDLDALLTDLAGADGAAETLDALLADMGTTELGAETVEADVAEAPAPEARVGTAVPVQSPYGTISAPQPEREAMNRNRFRMAIFGDFSGRASRGKLEVGDALAARRPILLDVDTVEEVIAGFATTLTLPIGKDGAGIEVSLGELDDLHPDELYEKVEIFEAISGLRQQLSVGSMAGRATERLKGWAEEFGTPVKLPKRSAATSVPPDLKLSDFQALIGDTRGTLTKATPAEDLIARIVGPHVVKAPDAGAAEMLDAVDEALSSAMRLVLHHPDFQAVESTWRSLDMLARRIETDASLEIVLYDVSAEELASDLAAQEDLSQSGLFRLLTDVMDPEQGEGGFSALFGLYTFEETPPHAELLARIGLVAAHVDAPFFAAMSPAYLETPKEERHTLVARAWDGLRALPQAAHLGLASPRFMLRLPYGAKSEPCYEFEFEEFTRQEGLKGLLWANPVVLVAILLAATWKKDGKAMELGSLMSLGDIPFTYVTDRYGDQVALPCTERNLTSDAAQATLGRGYMPVLSMKGRNEVRLGSFRSLRGDEIAGPWSDAAPARPAPPQPTLEMEIAADPAAPGSRETGQDASDDALADLDALLDTGEDADAGEAFDRLGSDDDDGQSLDDLLASFADDDDAAGDDDDMDPELAALLEGL